MINSPAINSTPVNSRGRRELVLPTGTRWGLNPGVSATAQTGVRWAKIGAQLYEFKIPDKWVFSVRPSFWSVTNDQWNVPGKSPVTIGFPTYWQVATNSAQVRADKAQWAVDVFPGVLLSQRTGWGVSVVKALQTEHRPRWAVDTLAESPASGIKFQWAKEGRVAVVTTLTDQWTQDAPALDVTCVNREVYRLNTFELATLPLQTQWTTEHPTQVLPRTERATYAVNTYTDSLFPHTSRWAFEFFPLADNRDRLPVTGMAWALQAQQEAVLATTGRYSMDAYRAADLTTADRWGLASLRVMATATRDKWPLAVVRAMTTTTRDRYSVAVVRQITFNRPLQWRLSTVQRFLDRKVDDRFSVDALSGFIATHTTQWARVQPRGSIRATEMRYALDTKEALETSLADGWQSPSTREAFSTATFQYALACPSERFPPPLTDRWRMDAFTEAFPATASAWSLSVMKPLDCKFATNWQTFAVKSYSTSLRDTWAKYGQAAVYSTSAGWTLNTMAELFSTTADRWAFRAGAKAYAIQVARYAVLSPTRAALFAQPTRWNRPVQIAGVLSAHDRWALGVVEAIELDLELVTEDTGTAEVNLELVTSFRGTAQVDFLFTTVPAPQLEVISFEAQFFEPGTATLDLELETRPRTWEVSTGLELELVETGEAVIGLEGHYVTTEAQAEIDQYLGLHGDPDLPIPGWVGQGTLATYFPPTTPTGGPQAGQAYRVLDPTVFTEDRPWSPDPRYALRGWTIRFARWDDDSPPQAPHLRDETLLSGISTITREENASDIAELGIKVDGLNGAQSWQAAKISVFLYNDVPLWRNPATEDLDAASMTGASVFTGTVIDVRYNEAERTATLTASSQLQQQIANASLALINRRVRSAAGGAGGARPLPLWHQDIFGSYANHWEYLQQVLTGVPVAVGTETATGTPVFRKLSGAGTVSLPAETLIHGTTSVTPSGGNNLIAQTIIKAQYRFERIFEMSTLFLWRMDMVYRTPAGASGVLTTPNCSTIAAAIQSTGWALDGDILFDQTPEAGVIDISSTINYVPAVPRGIDAMGASFRLKRRWSQTITETYRFELVNGAAADVGSIKRVDFGVAADYSPSPFYGEAFEQKATTIEAVTGGDGPSDGPQPVRAYQLKADGSREEKEVLIYPSPIESYLRTVTLSKDIPYGTVDLPVYPVGLRVSQTKAGPSGITYCDLTEATDTPRGNRQDFEDATSLAIRIAKREMEESAYQATGEAETLLRIGIEPSITVRCTAPGLEFSGRVKRVVHTFNLDAGAATTKVTAATRGFMSGEPALPENLSYTPTFVPVQPPTSFKDVYQLGTWVGGGYDGRVRPSDAVKSGWVTNYDPPFGSDDLETQQFIIPVSGVDAENIQESEIDHKPKIIPVGQ